VGLGAPTERRRGDRELQRLGGERRGGDLHRLEAVVGDRVGARADHQVRGEPAARLGHAEEAELAVDQVRDTGDRVLQTVHREGDVPAVEVAAVEHVAALGVDQRVVVDAVHLDLEGAERLLRGLDQDADHVGRAADRVAILEPLGGGRRRVVIAAQIGADPRRDALGPRVGLPGEEPRIEVAGVAARHLTRDRRQPRGQARQAQRALGGEAGEGGHHRRAVHERQALLRTEREGLEPDLAERLARRKDAAAVRDLPLADQRRDQVGERRQVAARADRAALGDVRQDAVVQEIAEPLEELDAHPRPALGQTREANRHHGRGLGLGEEGTRAAAVEAHQVVRHLGALLGGDLVLHRCPDAGRDAVDGAPRTECGLQGTGRGADPSPEDGARVEPDLRLAPGDREDVPDRHGIRADDADTGGLSHLVTQEPGE
jgi:hypothetical protein